MKLWDSPLVAFFTREFTHIALRLYYLSLPYFSNNSVARFCVCNNCSGVSLPAGSSRWFSQFLLPPNEETECHVYAVA